MKLVEVDEELKTLLKIYTEAETHLKTREQSSLDTLNYYMKNYIDTHEERKSISEKLSTLKYKLSLEESCEDEEDDD